MCIFHFATPAQQQRGCLLLDDFILVWNSRWLWAVGVLATAVLLVSRMIGCLRLEVFCLILLVAQLPRVAREIRKSRRTLTGLQHPGTQTVLITGTSSGIGHALSVLFAQKGYNVIATARREAELRHLVEQLRQVSPPKAAACQHAWIVADLSSPSGRSHLLAELKQHQVDILVNNAGLLHAGALAEICADSCHQLVEVNARAVVELTHALLPGILARQGRVVNLGSLYSVSPGPYTAVYAATKAFVYQFTCSLYWELVAVQNSQMLPLGVVWHALLTLGKFMWGGLWGEEESRGPTVTCVCPGPVDTELVRGNALVHECEVLASLTSATETVARRAYVCALNGVLTAALTPVEFWMLRLFQVLPVELTSCLVGSSLQYFKK